MTCRDTFDSNRKPFEARHQYWETHAPKDELGQAITGAAYPAGEDYFNLYDSQFIPVVQRGDLKAALALLQGPMRAKFTANQAAVDQIMTQNDTQRAARACQDLSNLALDLQNTVARFQVAV